MRAVRTRSPMSCRASCGVGAELKEKAGDWSGGVGIAVWHRLWQTVVVLASLGQKSVSKRGCPSVLALAVSCTIGGVEEVMVSCQAVKEEPFQYSTPRFICDFYLSQNGSTRQV